MSLSIIGPHALTNQIAMLLEDFKIDGALPPEKQQRLHALMTELNERVKKIKVAP